MPETSTAIAEYAPLPEELAGFSASELAIRPGQVSFSDMQKAALRILGVEDASDGDLAVFHHACQTSGLDPWRKEIYMIGRNTKVTEWVGEDGSRRKVERWVTKYTIQTGIDGFRRKVAEYATAKGDELAMDGPYYSGEDGVWREVWPKGAPPHAAKFTITKNGVPYPAVCHFEEYVQTTNSGEPNSMWAKMPRNQIGKCAEALACRRVYPNEFAGLVLDIAAQNVATSGVVVDQEGDVIDPPRKVQSQRARGTTALDERAARAAAAAPSESTEQLRKSARDQLNNAIFAIFGDLDLASDKQRGDRLIVVRSLLKKPDLESTKNLNDADLQKLRNMLFDRQKDGVLEDEIREILNAATLAEDGAAAAAEQQGADQ